MTTPYQTIEDSIKTLLATAGASQVEAFEGEVSDFMQIGIAVNPPTILVRFAGEEQREGARQTMTGQAQMFTVTVQVVCIANDLRGSDERREAAYTLAQAVKGLFHATPCLSYGGATLTAPFRYTGGLPGIIIDANNDAFSTMILTYQFEWKLVTT